MTTTIDTTNGRHVLERILDATERRDLEALRPLMHEQLVSSWPQSGERFTGPDNAMGAMLSTAVKPEVVGEPRIVGAGDTWVMMLPLRYGSDPYHYVGVFELEDGKLRRVTEYFGAPFPAQEARAQFADPTVS